MWSEATSPAGFGVVDCDVLTSPVQIGQNWPDYPRNGMAGKAMDIFLSSFLPITASHTQSSEDISDQSKAVGMLTSEMLSKREPGGLGFLAALCQRVAQPLQRGRGGGGWGDSVGDGSGGQRSAVLDHQSQSSITFSVATWPLSHPNHRNKYCRSAAIVLEQLSHSRSLWGQHFL